MEELCREFATLRWENEMADHEYGHPGEKEPRAHGETHHEQGTVDLNTASEQELADLPMVGPTRARALVENRPFHSCEDVEQVPSFSKGMVDDLKSGGAKVGSEEGAKT
jgi:DNA uptake protein ComE-like DNA-binding protein